jgi:hypothetical protein
MEVIRITETESVVVESEESTTVVSGLMGPIGPQGPTGPRGEGLAISDAVNTISQLPAVGYPGQSIYVAETGKLYIWSSV